MEGTNFAPLQATQRLNSKDEKPRSVKWKRAHGVCYGTAAGLANGRIEVPRCVKATVHKRALKLKRLLPVNNDIHGLIDSVNEGSTSAFMWEWFTTKPWVDTGKARFVSQFYSIQSQPNIG
jgi:hypothetical protein